MAALWCWLLILSAVECICPDMWTRYSGSCYLFVEPQDKWHDAMGKCRTMEAHLVEIDSADEFTFLKSQIRLLNMAKTDGFWTGGNDIEIEGIWKWGDSLKNIQMTFWYPSEPSSVGAGTHQEDCINLPMWQDLAWNDESCDRPMSYICELEDEGNLGGGSSEIIG